MFVGRENELQTLQKLYNSGNSEFLVLYGRRRIGKTTLLKHFLSGKKAIFFTAVEDYPVSESLKQFYERVSERTGTVSFMSGFESWEKALMFIGEQAKNERLVLVIDEYPYLATAYKSISSIIQKLWDEYLKDTKLFIILCGSYMSFMENEVLAYKSPLYGRRTAQLKLEKLDYQEAGYFFKNYDKQDRLVAYSILDGIPEYLKKFSDTLTIEENIKNAILDKSTYLYNEANLLVRQELREPQRYYSIIEAIALGNTKLGDIYTRTALDKAVINQYLKSLKELNIVEREVPVTEHNPLKSKMGIYKLVDNYFKFWFRFVLPNMSELEENEVEYVFEKKVQPFLSEYMGYVFENICMQFLKKLKKQNALPFRFSNIGRWWYKAEEIDIVAFDTENVLFGECKWQNRIIGVNELNRLKDKAKFANQGRWGREYFVLFSKSGFSSELVEQAKTDDDLLLFSAEDM